MKSAVKSMAGLTLCIVGLGVGAYHFPSNATHCLWFWLAWLPACSPYSYLAASKLKD